MVDLIDHFSDLEVCQLWHNIFKNKNKNMVGGGLKSKIGIDGGWVGFFFVKCVKVAPTPRLINNGRASILNTGSYVMDLVTVL